MLKTNQILYNPFKHHLSYVKNVINISKNIDSILPEIKKLGASKMDMYYGKVSVSDLFDELISLIPANNEEQFKHWIISGKGFQTIEIGDSSEWVLRYAIENQFVHIHPGRYTNHTIRVSANILKTAIIGVAAMQYQRVHLLNTKTINNLRTAFLDLSPIHSLDKSEQINQIVDLLSK